MTSDRGEITSDKIDALSAVLHLDVYTTLREIQKVPDTVLVSKKVNVEGYPNEPSGPNSKRKRSCLTTLPASLPVADNMVTQCPGHTEKLLTSNENTYPGCQFGFDEAEGRADETVLAKEDIGHGDSLGFSQHTDLVDISVRKPGLREDTQLPAYTTAGKCGGTTSEEVKVDKENFSSSDMGKTLEDGDKLLVKDNLAKDVRMGLSGPKNNEHHETASSSNGEVAQVWANDFISAAEVEIPHERDSCEEDGSSSEGTFGVEDSSLGVDFGAEGSFSFRKKRKVANPILTPSPLLEDDLIADGLTSNCSKLDQAYSPLPDTEAGQREDTHSPAVTAANKCGSIVGEDNLALKEDLSSCSNNNACFPNSSDELTDSDSDPEDLLSFSDFSLPSNPKASASQPRNRIVYGAEERFNRKPVSAYPNNNFSLGKFVQKATSGNAQTVAKIPPPVPQGISKVVQNLNLVHGKPNLKKSQQISAVPNVFPRPINSNRSRDFPTHATKSRTWHRTGSSSVAVAGPKLQPCPLPQSRETNMPRTAQSSYMRKGNSLVRKPSPSTATPPGLSSSVYKRSPCIDTLEKKQPSNGKIDGVDAPTVHRLEPVNIFESPEAPPIERSVKSSNSTTCNLQESSSGNGCSSKILGAIDVIKKSSAIPENCQNGSRNNSDSQSTLDQRNSRKKIKYVKRRSNQLVAASDFEEESISGVDKIQSSFSDGYFKSRKNQLVRASVAENHATNGDAAAEVNSSKLVLKELPLRISGKRQSSKGFAKTYRSSKFSFVWKLHDVHSSQKHNHPERSQKVLSHLFPWKRATYRRSVMLALGSKPNNDYSAVSQKVLLSRKRGAVYTKSTHGYSLRMSKVLSVGGSSLKWSKTIERISKKTNEEATRAVAAAEKTKKEERIAVPVVSKSRNHVSRKLVLSVKQRAGERIFRIGSERYKMDPTRRTLCRITEEKPSSSIVIQPDKIVKRSYVPKRLFIGNDEYVRIGTGNQLIRDPKKRTRVLASEKIRWSLRTARMRLARKRKYCQFFTRFGKCNKEDGKCPYIHDPSKIAVCTKFLNGSCSNPDCKLTHKVIPERMQDCSYFVKGSCSNENCPYRHVNVEPDSSVCESFLRGYCIDGNECRKKHTYVCPAFEETGVCPQASTCKLHHPKKKIENKPKSEQKSVLGRYFDGGLIGVADCSSMDTSEKLSAKGKDDIGFSEGKYPDYISLDVSDDEV
ncbi:hypothetical protein ACJIZ3_024641 [Penstemon smallii]|uniref:C3H1-type domain-containing protein n=1 Tax=Penstemon smallii TaxID=265156 RepID=A0ABD3TSQ5_9LAMI